MPLSFFLTFVFWNLFWNSWKTAHLLNSNHNLSFICQKFIFIQQEMLILFSAFIMSWIMMFFSYVLRDTCSIIRLLGLVVLVWDGDHLGLSCCEGIWKNIVDDWCILHVWVLFFKFSSLGKCGCSILLFDNLEYVRMCRFSCIHTVFWVYMSWIIMFSSDVLRDTSPIIRLFGSCSFG